LQLVEIDRLHILQEGRQQIAKTRIQLDPVVEELDLLCVELSRGGRWRDGGIFRPHRIEGRERIVDETGQRFWGGHDVCAEPAHQGLQLLHGVGRSQPEELVDVDALGIVPSGEHLPNQRGGFLGEALLVGKYLFDQRDLVLLGLEDDVDIAGRHVFQALQRALRDPLLGRDQLGV
jgi:hypothetical protein